MARITIIGGTGYSGSHIAAEAIARGHEVASFSRSLPDAENSVEGVDYKSGSIEQAQALVDAIGDTDVVVFAVSPRAGMEGAGKTSAAVRETVALIPDNIRVGVVGGAGSSLVAPGGAQVMDEGFPAEVLPEAQEMGRVLADLRDSGTAHDWFVVHPAGGFGPWAPGERTGSYRDGGDVIVTDENGESFIGGADFAIAFLDEIENPKHRGERFTVGY